MSTVFRRRQQGEDPYDFCLALITDGNLDAAERQLLHIDAPAVRRIANDQINFVRAILSCIERGETGRARKLCSRLIGDIETKFRGILAETAEKTPTADESSVAQADEQEQPASPTESELSPRKTAAIEREEDVPAHVREVLGNVRGRAYSFPDPVFDELTRMACMRWQKNWRKKSMGTAPSELALIGVLLENAMGEQAPLTVEALQGKLQWGRAAIQKTIRALRSHVLRDTRWTILDCHGGAVILEQVKHSEPQA